MTSESKGSVAIVAIGRNEGERLKSCLRAAVGGARTVVYVDSGSTDGSANFARSVGCQVVELDLDLPYSAARARNEGFARAMNIDPDAAFVQFVDGDCALVDGWLERGGAALNDRPDVGVVCGHVREMHPEASVYNRLFDLEWRQRPGELNACGGIFMVRPAVFSRVGGFRRDVIAGEDNEFCVRVRQTGHKILLLDAPMVWHDAAMFRFKEWWRRARRTRVCASGGHAWQQRRTLFHARMPANLDLGPGDSDDCFAACAVHARHFALSALSLWAAVWMDSAQREEAWLAVGRFGGLRVFHCAHQVSRA
jgi:GT2 family glycosyltransferase